MRTITFQTLLTAFAGAARVGRATLQPEEESQFCADLNAASLHLWEVETHSVALPDMLTGKTVTLGTDGVIAAADIEDAAFWSVWQSDPREVVDGEGRSSLQIRATALGNGDVKTSRTAGTEVFVIYKTQVPQWTVTAASAACSYAEGDLVLFNGRVYRSLADDVSAGDLTDTTNWEEVTLPQSLQRLVVTKANYERIRLGTNMPENAGRERFEYERALDSAFIGAQNEPSGKPWLYNQNQ